jgi:glutathione synthase/RimK-type ligase-like ATP-grasp enzyme
MKLGIFKAWNDKDWQSYEKACIDLNVGYEIIDLLSDNWLEIIKDSKCDGFLCRPPCDIQERKSIYDEKLYFITHFMNKKIYPSYDELFIYENKRNMSYFLKTFNYSHPKTRVFSRKEDAMSFINSCKYPIVFKSNIGAGASGVNIIKSKNEASNIINQIFGRLHPRFTFGKIIWTKYKNFPLPTIGLNQKHFLIAQDFYHIKWEWRIIKIGNNFAGHQKLLSGEFASGSDLVGWVKPPIELLELVKKITEKHQFYSVAIDIFETLDGKFLINEIQSIFGSYLHYQMKFNNQRGVFQYKDNDFVFVEGEYHQNNSNNIRVKHFLEILENEQ